MHVIAFEDAGAWPLRGGRRLEPLVWIASFDSLSTLIFVCDMVSSWRGSTRAEANPWRSLTLE